MRILIIAHQRSGSTNFAKWLSAELNHLCILEPFNTDNSNWNWDKDKRMHFSLTEKNIVCKCIYTQFTDNGVIEKWISLFDKIILLKRNNIRNSIISEIYANSVGIYHDTYKIDNDWIIKNENKIEENIPKFTKYNKEIDELKGLHITYEGIYDTNEDIEKVKNYLQIDKLNYTSYIDKKRRYQNNTNIKNLI
jgi:hypothetical protein